MKDEKLINKENAMALIGFNLGKLKAIESDLICQNAGNILITSGEGVTDYLIGLHYPIQLLAAELIIEQKKLDPEIKLFIVKSKNDNCNWTKTQTKAYKKIINNADRIFYPCSKYGKLTDEICNNWMIDHSAGIIPIYTGDLDAVDTIVKMAILLGKGYIGPGSKRNV